MNDDLFSHERCVHNIFEDFQKGKHICWSLECMIMLSERLGVQTTSRHQSPLSPILFLLTMTLLYVVGFVMDLCR